MSPQTGAHETQALAMLQELADLCVQRAEEYGSEPRLRARGELIGATRMYWLIFGSQESIETLTGRFTARAWEKSKTRTTGGKTA